MSYQVSKLRRQPYSPVALLTTVGRRTGLLRTVTLPYAHHGDDYVVVGSLGGGPHDPQWVHNIREDSRCWITIRRRMFAAEASVAEGDARARALDAVVAVRPFVVNYDTRALSFGRVMPIVVVHLTHANRSTLAGPPERA